jgi:hypothetical protein
MSQGIPDAVNPLDPALFRAAAISAETAHFNEVRVPSLFRRNQLGHAPSRSTEIAAPKFRCESWHPKIRVAFIFICTAAGWCWARPTCRTQCSNA